MKSTSYEMNRYQRDAAEFDLHKKFSVDLPNHPALMEKVFGLTEEAGEVAGKFKRIMRRKDDRITVGAATEIIKELGDVMWYVAMIADYLDVSLSDVALRNINKLSDRNSRGTIEGSGDNR